VYSVAFSIKLFPIMDAREICQKVESFLASHPKAALPIVTEKLGLTHKQIEQALCEVEGISFEQFRQSRRLAEAFRELGVDRVVPLGPWETPRVRSRIIIPRTTVRWRVRSLWTGRAYSGPCPLCDLSGGGLAFLADTPTLPGKRVSLLLKFPEREEEFRLEGRAVYAVATGIAGYRYRTGIEFLPFGQRRGCNSPKILDAIRQFEPK
jgi:hypothetical protein